MRAAPRRRGDVVVKPFVSKGLDPVIGERAKSIVASGKLDAAIAEVAASDPDLASWSSSTTDYRGSRGFVSWATCWLQLLL